jgi:tetratricopeptide (TPR) repeat protein
VTSLRPEPLGDREATALIKAATDELPFPPHVVAALAERSGGNPLFLTELIAAARDQGVDSLPDSVEALLAVQIDRLSPRDRTVLRYASVLGVNFPQDFLRAALEGQEYALDDGVWQRLGDFVGRDRTGIARFRHALIRDAAYEGLPYKRRHELHARVGETIERLAGADADEQAELLSLHFFNAQHHGKAWAYSRAAGERALAKFAKVEARDFYARALAAARHAEVTPAEVAAVRESLGDIADRIGLFDEALVAFRTVRRELRGDALAEARLLLKEAYITEQTGHHLSATRALKRGLRCLDGVDGPAAASQRAQLSIWHAFSLYERDRHREAVRWCERAIAEAEAANDRFSLAWAYMVLDLVTAVLGEPETVQYGRLALAIYEELGDLQRQASVLNNLGQRALYEGRWPEAVELNERAADLYLRMGNTIDHMEVISNLSEVLSYQGRLDEAEAHALEVERVMRATGRDWVMYAQRELGRIAYRSGRYDEALPLLREARAGWSRSGAEAEVRECDMGIAECFVLMGETEAALDLLDELAAYIEAEGEIADLRMTRIERIRGFALLRRAGAARRRRRRRPPRPEPSDSRPPRRRRHASGFGPDVRRLHPGRPGAAVSFELLGVICPCRRRRPTSGS